MKKNKLYIILVILAACVIAFFGRHDVNSKSTKETELREAVTTNKESLENKTKRLEIVVDEGDVFSTVALRAGINEEQSFKLYEKVKPVYDLASLKIGHMFIFDINDKTELIKIVYNIDDERELIIVRASIDEDWQASINAINYEI